MRGRLARSDTGTVPVLGIAPSHADRSSIATFQAGEVNFLQYTPVGGAYLCCSLLQVGGGDPDPEPEAGRSEQANEQTNRVVLGRDRRAAADPAGGREPGLEVRGRRPSAGHDPGRAHVFVPLFTVPSAAAGAPRRTGRAQHRGPPRAPATTARRRAGSSSPRTGRPRARSPLHAAPAGRCWCCWTASRWPPSATLGPAWPPRRCPASARSDVAVAGCGCGTVKRCGSGRGANGSGTSRDERRGSAAQSWAGDGLARRVPHCPPPRCWTSWGSRRAAAAWTSAAARARRRRTRPQGRAARVGAGPGPRPYRAGAGRAGGRRGRQRHLLCPQVQGHGPRDARWVAVPGMGRVHHRRHLDQADSTRHRR